jgi:hypothetical protein
MENGNKSMNLSFLILSLQNIYMDIKRKKGMKNSRK